MENCGSYGKALKAAFAAALAGALLSVVYLSLSVTPARDGEYLDVSAVKVHESNLIAGEALISVSFALAAAVLLLSGRGKGRTLPLVTAAARIFMVLWQFILHWKPGWYYIMDPADATAGSWLLIVLAAVQVAAFATAGAVSGGRVAS